MDNDFGEMFFQPANEPKSKKTLAMYPFCRCGYKFTQADYIPDKTRTLGMFPERCPNCNKIIRAFTVSNEPIKDMTKERAKVGDDETEIFIVVKE